MGKLSGCRRVLARLCTGTPGARILQHAMSPEDIEKTAFVTRYGFYEYNVLPLGLCNAPSMFERLMNEAMKGYIDDFVGVHLDDILVYTDGDAKDHERDLQKVFDHLQKHNSSW